MQKCCKVEVILFKNTPEDKKIKIQKHRYSLFVAQYQMIHGLVPVQGLGGWGPLLQSLKTVAWGNAGIRSGPEASEGPVAAEPISYGGE